MKHFSSKKEKCCFKGWYFKHSNGSETLAFIPGICIDENEAKQAFIQIITNDISYNINYDYNDFIMDEDRLFIKIGDNIFSEDGISISIERDSISCHGHIYYSNLKPINYNAMGPFTFIPFMECYHGVISLFHKLRGSIMIEGKDITFDNGIGYIEMDWGRSFPNKYLWIQCNEFQFQNLSNRLSVMSAVAEIPFCGKSFTGCICIINFKNREYRLATYLGAKVLVWNDSELLIKQGPYVLSIKTNGSSHRQKLFAPNNGCMERIIHESSLCTATFKFYYKNRLLFNKRSNRTGFEFVE